VDPEKLDIPDRTTAAVDACVADAAKSERPFRQINDFLLLLKRSKWTEAELLEVQTRVLAALKKRRESRPAR
jgi:hypothetical protein